MKNLFFKSPARGVIAPLTLLLLAMLGSGCSAMASKSTTDITKSESLPDPVKAQQAVARGDVAARSGNNDAALMEYVAALQMDPQSADIRYRIGVVHTSRGDQKAAQQAYADAVNADPKHAGALEGLGLSLLRTQQSQQARDLLTRSLAQDDKRWRAHSGLGVLADLAHDPATAARHYQAALQLQPQHPDLHNNMGYSRYLAGDYPAAVRHFEQVLGYDNDNSTAWSNLALVKVRQGDYSGAVSAFSEILAPHEAYNNVGYLLYKAGKMNEAKWHLQRAIALSPSYYAVAQQNLARVTITTPASGTVTAVKSAPVPARAQQVPKASAAAVATVAVQKKVVMPGKQLPN